jgi:hypothetical protein
MHVCVSGDGSWRVELCWGGMYYLYTCGWRLELNSPNSRKELIPPKHLGGVKNRERSLDVVSRKKKNYH